MYMHQAVAFRYGSLNPTDITGTRNYVLYNQNTGSGAGMFGITSANVTATRTGSGTEADRMTVTVTGFHYPMIAPGFSGDAKPGDQRNAPGGSQLTPYYNSGCKWSVLPATT